MIVIFRAQAADKILYLKLTNIEFISRVEHTYILYWKLEMLVFVMKWLCILFVKKTGDLLGGFQTLRKEHGLFVTL